MVLALCSLLIVAIAALAIVIIAYKWHRQMESFFRDKNIPFVASSIFGGSFKDILLCRKSVAQVMLSVYEEATKRGVPCIGVRFLHRNCLVLRDLDLIKRVLVKDFNHFSDRSAYANIHRDPFGGYNLFLAKNPFWHEMRSKITPMFSTSRMKLFFEEVNGIGAKLGAKLLRDIPNKRVVSLKDLNGSYTTDVYASCSFGLEINFIENPESAFGQSALKMFDFDLFRALEFGSCFIAPELSKFLPIYFFSKDGSLYLKKVLSSVLGKRKLMKSSRNDLMDLIIKVQSQEGDSKQTHFDENMLLAQCVIFFIAGFETTSTALTHALYELTKNSRVQAKLRKEISDHFEIHGALTYENLAALKYLTMVCKETFRLYPAFSFINRVCTPDTQNGTQDALYSLLPELGGLPNGLPIYIPTYALHRDEAYFPEANKFKPERFDTEDDFGAYLPFGIGPRHCLAQRLAYMVLKIGLVNILRFHSVESCQDTPKEIQPHKLAMLVVPDQKISVRVKREDV